jgi:hypothetical protein
MNIHPLPPHPASALAQRLDGILASITDFLFGRIRTPDDLVSRLHNRIARARRRLVTLLALLAAGRLPRLSAPRPNRQGGSAALPVPRRRAWLIATFGYRIAGYASQLEHLLRDPQTLATLAAAPPTALESAARTLRPLCHLLGVALPPILQPPPRAPVARILKPRPAKSPAPVAPAQAAPASVAPAPPVPITPPSGDSAGWSLDIADPDAWSHHPLFKIG